MGLVAVTPGVQDLQGDFAAFIMHCIGNDAMVCKLAGVIEHRAAFHPHAGKRRRNASAHNQSHTVTGALGVERGQPFCTVGIFLQPGMH